jgi:hypothetical protein
MFDRHGHLTECSIVSYLVGDLDELGTRRLEHHVGACPDCAARLEQEAVFETALYDAADSLDVVVPPRRRSWERIAVAATAIASMAAALVLGLADPKRWIDVHSGNADAPEVSLRPAAIAGEDVTMASDTGTCFPPVVDDPDDCEDVVTVALATFPDEHEMAEPAVFDGFAPRAPICEDDEDSGPICLDG